MAGTSGQYQSLKSAQSSRVDLGQVQRLASSRQDLGEGLMCPAGSGSISNDVYGRPANMNTLTVNLPYDASCSNYTYDAAWQMQRETNERPYMPICAAGLRGAADFMGVGRDLMPQNVYGGVSGRGNFIRTFNTPNNAPYPDDISTAMPTEKRIYPPFTFSMDGTRNLLRL